MPRLVVAPGMLPPELVGRIVAAAAGWELALEPYAVVDADVAFDVVDAELLAAARRLRWLHVSSAGVDALPLASLAERGIDVTCAKGLVGTQLAEQAFANLLALTRGVAEAVLEGTEVDAARLRSRLVELDGAVMGIVGRGGAGAEVARRAEAFGMEVVAVGSADPPAALDDLLARSDVVCICAPLTERTRGLLGADAFARIKPGAFLVNVSRGEIVDERALLDALASGRLGGAALDTPPVDPLPADHPLRRLGNVVVTPHVAGASPARAARVVDAFLDNLRRFERGEPLVGLVDPERGY